MSQHDFSALYNKYPSVIEQMPAKFTSHQFILRLAQQNQTLYIDALDSYRHKDSPFMIVHGILARRLHAYPKMIEQVRHDAPSTDIVDQSSQCAEWHRRG